MSKKTPPKKAAAVKPVAVKPPAKKVVAKKPVQHIQQVKYRTNRYLINLASLPHLANGMPDTTKPPKPTMIFVDVHNITDGISFAHFNEELFAQLYIEVSKIVKYPVNNSNSIMHLCSLLDTYQQKAYIKTEPRVTATAAPEAESEIEEEE